MKNLKLYRWAFLPVVLFFVSGYSQTKLLTKIDGGASWDGLAFSSGAVEFMPASNGYITGNQDYTIIDEENRLTKTIFLHDGTPGHDDPPHGMILNIVNRSNTRLHFSCGGACGYESINVTFLLGASAEIAAHSSLVLQWNSGTSRWYEIL